jgi:hypothetical protein
LANVQALIAGTQKHTPTGSVSFGNATYTVADLIALLSSVVAAMTALNVAQAGAKDALTALRAVMAKVGPVIQGYRRYLRTTYGSATQTLADYGLEPEKARRPLTTEERAAALQKSLATREMRGTKGRKQKAKVKATAAQAEQMAAANSVPAPTGSPAVPALAGQAAKPTA